MDTSSLNHDDDNNAGPSKPRVEDIFDDEEEDDDEFASPGPAAGDLSQAPLYVHLQSSSR